MKKKEINQRQLEDLYSKYKRKEITKKEMAKQLNICIATLNKRIDKLNSTEELHNEDLSQEQKKASDEIKVFNNEEFGSVRVVIINDEPWFVGKDVADLLGYMKARNAINTHVDIEDRNTALIQGGNKKGNPNKVIINESGLYSLILSSKLPSAKRFKHWVTSEILPSVRKHGAYMTSETLEKALYNPDFLIKLATSLKTEQQKNKYLTQQLEEEREKTDDLQFRNKMLVADIKTWNPNSIVNKLIRSYGYRCCNENYGMAWAEYYKQLLYKYHIDIKKRRSFSGRGKLTELLKGEEINQAVRAAVAMCEDNDINVEKLIGKYNVV